MDSTEHTMADLGLTPGYIKTTLEDLANDQLRTEDAVASLTVRVYVTGGVGLLALAVGLLTSRVVKSLADGLNQIGQAVVMTQQHVGMIPVQEPPDERPAKATPPTTEPVFTDPYPVDAPAPDTFDVGAGYDPGPQDVPPAVREKIESEPVSDWLDEDM